MGLEYSTNKETSCDETLANLVSTSICGHNNFLQQTGRQIVALNWSLGLGVNRPKKRESCTITCTTSNLHTCMHDDTN